MRPKTLLIPLLSIASSVAAVDVRADEPSFDDAAAWAKNRPHKREIELVDTSKWDLGGALVPAVQLPFFLTDPFHADHVGAPSSMVSGYAVEWRVGWSFGRVSIEPLGGYMHVSRDAITLPNGTSQEASLSRTYVGGQLRYTIPFGRVSPFLAVGGAYDVWNSPLLVRDGGSGVRVDNAPSGSAHARLGTFVRLAPVGSTTALFLEAGVDGSYMLKNDVFENDQVVIAPYLALSFMGSVSPEDRPNVAVTRDPVRDAHEQARQDAVRVQQECERGNAHACEGLIRFLYSEATGEDGHVVPGVDELTQSVVGIPWEAPGDAAKPQLLAAWSTYERVSFEAARSAADPATYESFLARFPHGKHAPEAQQAIFDLELQPIEQTAKDKHTVAPLLAYYEKNPSSLRVREVLVATPVTGLPHDDLVALMKLDPKVDSRFAKVAQAAAEEDDNLAFAAASRLPDADAAAALHDFVLKHPSSKRRGEAEALEPEKAFASATSKTGEEGLMALRTFRERYPSSPRATEAAQRERNLMFDLANNAREAAPKWRFLDFAPNDERVVAVRDSLAALLVSTSSKEPSTEYERFLDRFPDHPSARAITARMKQLKRKEAAAAGQGNKP